MDKIDELDDFLDFEESIPATASVQLAEVINSLIPEGDFRARDIAAEIDRLHPGLVKEWLEENRLAILTDFISTRLRHDRKRKTRAGKFGEAAERIENGENAAEVFSEHFVVDNQNTWRQLGKMTGDDHRFVAAMYEYTEKTSGLYRQFHTVLAEKIGDKTTEEVIKPEEYIRLRNSIIGR